MDERKVVWVRWTDACGEDARVTSDDIDAGKLDPLEMVSIGHLLRETPEYVVIAQDRYTMQGKQLWRNWMTIPRVCIQALVYLAPAPLTEQPDEAIGHVIAPEPVEVEAESEEHALRRRLEEAQRTLGDFYTRRREDEDRSARLRIGRR